MPNLALIYLAFEVPKNINAISSKICWLEVQLYKTKNKMVVETKSGCLMNSEIIYNHHSCCIQFLQNFCNFRCNHHMLLHTLICKSQGA